MVEVIFLFRFRADRDPEDVRTWWLNAHSVIALKNRMSGAVVPLGETDTDSRAGHPLYPRTAQADSGRRR